MVLSFLFGPVYCGWICPFGTYQEWINRLGKKLFKKKYNTIIPRSIKKYLKYLRYLVLIWVVYITAYYKNFLNETSAIRSIIPNPSGRYPFV